MPTPFGVIYQNNDLKTYEDGITEQIAAMKLGNKKESFRQLLKTNQSWKVNQ